MDTNQWTQEIGGFKGMGEMASSTCSRTAVQERKVRPQKDQALNCPRCHSTNTKFCYYNNYSLTQPRYFCKTCRRYWTEGGTLRNVPVGGGSRKNKRSSANTSTSSSHKLSDLNPPNISHFAYRNSKIHDGQDLNLAFPPPQDHYHGGASQFFELPKIDSSSNELKSSSSSSSTSTPLAALDLLRTGIVSKGLNSYISSTSTTPAPDLNALYSTSGFSFQNLKPGISFSVDNGLGSRLAPSGIQQNGGRLMLPFGVMKQFPSTNQVDQNKGQSNSNGYWNGMLGGGSW